MIVSHGIDSSMVHRRQCSFWESSRFDCSEAACRIRPFGVRDPPLDAVPVGTSRQAATLKHSVAVTACK
jgi:hypothetical protein